ncbi:hypothetical protein L6452_17334 [Arctium lappa]|uniref:Uncharacterized protein n=1 Tax=Arctium lappa TaxID=4217 RepID=A0ACB9C363_ARCLA|nr:hypothetical protein L6452_17334 [Arctium lappa]
MATESSTELSVADKRVEEVQVQGDKIIISASNNELNIPETQLETDATESSNASNVGDRQKRKKKGRGFHGCPENFNGDGPNNLQECKEGNDNVKIGPGYHRVIDKIDGFGFCDVGPSRQQQDK